MPSPPRGATRRELLKLSPVLALGAFAIPKWQEGLLRAGLSWSDRASQLLFRRNHRVVSRPDTEVVPFDQFPYNGYDILEPAIDLSTWALRVSARTDPRAAEDRSEHPACVRGRMGRRRTLRRCA
ncbi:MAG TPA: hypothetical protein VNR64_20575, partial [Vicinamibacterales bacterium]|nr:hypothetical protein [Vicinamibacterales bacterium]